MPELFEEGVFLDDVYCFRGQGSADWKLTPAFDRWISSFGNRFASENFDELLGYFRDECEKLEVDKTRLADDEYLKSLGQHYGLPTRLLDWSRSPYVAAFFAFNAAFQHNVQDINQGSVAVWALRRESELFGPEKGVEIKKMSLSQNHRLLNQEGLFTVSQNPSKCLEDYIKSFEDQEVRLEDDRALYQFSIPNRDARAAIADLASMGLTYTRLFPDFVGCANAAQIRMILSQKF